MKWMELIKVQTAKSNVAGKLLDFIEDCRQCHGLLDAKVFHHAMVNDCSLFLLWNTEVPELLGSKVGLHMSNTLKQYGLIDHSVWIEKEGKEEKKS